MEIAALSALIALLSLDATAAGQFMLSRPVVVGPLVGLMAGDLGLGLAIGVLVELIWVGELPVGNNLPLDVTVLAGVAAALAGHWAHHEGAGIPREALVTLTLAVAIPLAALSSWVEQWVRRLHRWWVHLAQRWIEERKFLLADAVTWAVLLELFLKTWMLVFAGLWLLEIGTPWLLRFSDPFIEGFVYADWFLIALGCAAVLDQMVERKHLPFVFVPAALSAALVFFFGVDPLYLLIVALLGGFGICVRRYRIHAAGAPTPMAAPSTTPKMPFGMLCSCYVRMFFLQTVWNYERGLNYGLAFILSPALKRFYSPEERERALVRHLDYFNTQPYFASFIVGAVVRIEAERGEAPPPRQQQLEETVSALKVGMMSPAAAMGDRLFWATVRPYAALIAAAMAFTTSFQSGWLPLLVPAVYLAVYNAPHLMVRTTGFLQGLKMGERVTQTMKQYGVQEVIQCLRLSSAVLVGVLLVFVNHLETFKGPTLFSAKLLFFTAVFGLYSYFFHKKAHHALLFYSAVLFALILAYWPQLSAPVPAAGIPR